MKTFTKILLLLVVSLDCAMVSSYIIDIYVNSIINHALFGTIVTLIVVTSIYPIYRLINELKD